MTDPLADWWVHEIVVERFLGRSAYGDEFAEPVVLPCFVADGIKVTGNAQGEQVISTARATLPASTAYIPVESRVTLPPDFGNRVVKVVTVAVGNGGGQPTPDHVEIGLI